MKPKQVCTPGPWYTSGTGNHQGLVISEATGDNVAVTYNGDADAKLISAAHELLEVAELTLKLMASIPRRLGSFEEHLLTLSREAIEKAKGEYQ
jgi:hypothetical protein